MAVSLLAAVAGAAEDAAPSPPSNLRWYDVSQWGVEGKGWTDTERYYDRLPSRVKGKVIEPEWYLAMHSAGMVTRFETDATAIRARWRLLQTIWPYSKYGISLPPLMAGAGVSGLNLYVKDDQGQWRSLAVAEPDTSELIDVEMIKNLNPGLRQYMLYLPLYNAVESLEIGVDATATFTPIAPRREKPIIFYGTSIVQGAYASRSGMCHPAMLGRRLDRPVINLGFAGQGTMELKMADLLGELDPCVYVIDCLPNMDADLVAQRTEAFVQILRQARPDTPIVLIEDRFHGQEPFRQDMQIMYANNHKALRLAFDHLIAGGVKGLTYVPGDNLFGSDGEGTVGGSHPNDLGFMRMANVLEPILRPLIEGN
jgi:hypothetical protein